MEQINKELLAKQLDKYRNLHSQLKYSIDNKKQELNGIKGNEIVRKYINLNNRIEELELEDIEIKNNIKLLEQEICDHNILYLMSYQTYSFQYNPCFYCVECKKSMTGMLEKNQTCINEEYLERDVTNYSGSLDEYKMIRSEYKRLFDEGYTIEEIIVKLQKRLKKLHSNKGTKVRLLINEKKDDV